MLAIHAAGLAKTYSGAFGRRPQEALRGVDLEVSEGAAFGLIGPNGAGKTTFVKAILGLVRPSAGAARLLGGDPSDPRSRARVGYLPERLEFPPALDARAILRSVARLKRLRRPEADIDRRLGELGLSDVAGRRAGTYSKGMRQRLGLACALLGAPDLLVLDEPTDGLDPLARVEVRGLLARELGRGATLFLNSHLLSETERVCTRIGILVEGRIVREGTLDAMRECASRWTVRFDGNAPREPLAAAGFAPGAGGAWTFDGEPPALNEALERARRSGALLVELSRASRDLEAVLQDAVGVAR
jgi:ABC-2 type transport system ATP-binding protein